MSPVRVHLPGSILYLQRRSSVSSERPGDPRSPCCLASLVPFCMERTTLSCRHLVFPGRAPLVVIICSRSDIVTFPPRIAARHRCFPNSSQKESRAARAVTRHFCRSRGPELDLDWSIANALGETSNWRPSQQPTRTLSSRLSRAATPQSSRLIGEWGVHQCRRVACKGQKNAASSLFCACCMHAQARRASEDVLLG